MRFLNYLDEKTKENIDEDLLNFISSIKENCYQFLRESGKKPMFWGNMGNVKPYEIKDFPKNQSTREEDSQELKNIDKAFSKAFNKPMRSNSISCWFNKSHVEKFYTKSGLCVVYPFDGYESFTYNKMLDLSMFYQHSLNYWIPDNKSYWKSMSPGAKAFIILDKPDAKGQKRISEHKLPELKKEFKLDSLTDKEFYSKLASQCISLNDGCIKI